MKFVTDLHLHSKYSRAVSPSMVLPIMAEYARLKGLDILSASDWTHPLWLREIRAQLEESGEGLYKIKSQNSKVKNTIQNSKVNNEPLFLLSTEIASIYSQGGRVRRIHNLVFTPNFEVAEKINTELRNRGCNLNADGRPIIGLSSKNLLELCLSIDKRVIFIPAHAWTPHFGIYGSASGFDSLEEAFEEYTKYVYGIETGLSSDPWMNWQIRELDNRSILSFSDAHSPAKMGREATVFEIDKTSGNLNYMDVGKAIAKPDKNFHLDYTIEFYPEEGKYHYSGHRNCKVVQDPKEAQAQGSVCPVCKKRLTEGVMYRLSQLAQQNSKFKIQNSELDGNGVNWVSSGEENRPPFVRLVPLNEIIAESLSSVVTSEKVKKMFNDLCAKFGSEIEILLHTPVEDIESFSGEKIAEGVDKVRKGNIVIEPGYDGEYGKVKIWSEESLKEVKQEKREQIGLF